MTADIAKLVERLTDEAEMVSEGQLGRIAAANTLYGQAAAALVNLSGPTDPFEHCAKAAEWHPFETAPKEYGRRILAWCDAAESDSGVVEMVWRGKYWSRVIEDPWPNACLTPTHWRISPEAPASE